MIPELDKYAAYVWWSFGITAVVMLVVLGLSIQKSRRAARELDRLTAELERKQ